MDLDTRLKKLRRKKKVTREEVAEKTDIPLNLFIKYEKGTLYPLRKDLNALATYYEVEVDELLGKKDDKYEVREYWNKRIVVYSLGAAASILVIAFVILFSLYYWQGNISLAGILVPIISAFVLLITFAVFSMKFIKDKKERFKYNLGTIGINLIIFGMTIIINLGSFKGYTTYSKENWLNIEDRYKYYVLKDFTSKYDIKKMNREEVESYLGEPDENNDGAYNTRYYVYYLSHPVRMDRYEPYKLTIDFDQDKVIRYTIK